MRRWSNDPPEGAGSAAMAPRRGRGWGMLRLVPRGCRTVFLVAILLVGVLLYTLMHTPMRLTTVHLEGGVPPPRARQGTQTRAQPHVSMRGGEGSTGMGSGATSVLQRATQQISCPTYVGPGFDFKCVALHLFRRTLVSGEALHPL